MPRTRLTLVWLLLVAGTVIGWALGSQDHARAATAAGVLAVAIIKVRFVVMEFMELRTASFVIRLLFDLWAVALWTALVAMPLLIRA